MKVAPKFVSYGFTGIILLLLLFSGTFACWALLIHPLSPAECCAHGGCKHSPCQLGPVNPGQFVPPVTSSTQITLAVASLINADLDVPAVRVISTPHSIEYSPPALFLIHSCLLI